MDFTAVQQATDNDLNSPGLTKRGDILSLRSLTQRKTVEDSNERTEKKKKLLQLAQEIQTSRKKGKHDESDPPTTSEMHSFTKRKTCTRKLQIGWMHYSPKLERYVSVRYSKGGGAREISMNLHANARDIIKKARELFFPKGKSFHGDDLDMTFELGRFDCKPIKDEKFSLGKYIEVNKLTRVRLYLLSKCDDDISSEELSIAPFAKREAAPNGPDDNANTSTTSGSASSTSDGLIGTSHERVLLKQQQEEELKMSLESDQSKDRKKAEEQETFSRQKNLQMARKCRVPDIPPPGVPHVRVSLRHPTVGVHSRSFCQLENMSAVYDWAGSLALTPESFVLSKCDVPGTLPPSLSVTEVDKHLLSMSESESMPSYPGNSIDFIGFGSDDFLDLSESQLFQFHAMQTVIIDDDDDKM